MSSIDITKSGVADSSAGSASFLGAAVFLLLAVPSAAQSPAFEAISIKVAQPGEPRTMRMRVLPNGDFKATAVPVLLLVRYAYDVPVNPSPRLSGLPRWRETYDIEAKAPANAVPPGLPENDKRRRIQGMIRRLLADRFKLVMRVEQKTMPVYALTVARGGPNLRKSTIAEKDCVFDTGSPESCHNFIVGRGHPLTASAIDMDDLAHYIENWADLPVVNRTGLSGLFAVETEGWTPMRLPPPPPGNPPAARFDDLPTIFTVLRKLGLELKQQEATVPVYTVEHIERPAGERAASAPQDRFRIESLTAPTRLLPAGCRLAPDQASGNPSFMMYPSLRQNPWVGSGPTAASIRGVIDGPLGASALTGSARMKELENGIVEAYRARYRARDGSDVDVYAVAIDSMGSQ